MTTVLHNHLKISSWPPPFLTSDRQPSEETHRKMEQTTTLIAKKGWTQTNWKTPMKRSTYREASRKEASRILGSSSLYHPFLVRSATPCHAVPFHGWCHQHQPLSPTVGWDALYHAESRHTLRPLSTHCCCLSCHAPKLIELSRFLTPLFSCSLTRLRLVLAYQARSFFCCWVQPRRRRTFHVWCLFFARSRPCLQSRLWDGAFWVPFARVLSLRHARDLLLLCWSAATWGSATGTWVVTLWIDTDARADRQCHTGIRNSEVSLTSWGSFCDGYKRFTRVKEDKSDSEPSCANCSRLHYHED